MGKRRRWGAVHPLKRGTGKLLFCDLLSAVAVKRNTASVARPSRLRLLRSGLPGLPAAHRVVGRAAEAELGWNDAGRHHAGRLS